MGGKNSMFNKPLGAGDNSVNKGIENVIGKRAKNATDSLASFGTGNPVSGFRSAAKAVTGDKKKDESSSNPYSGTGGAGLEAGKKVGEELTGATVGEVGQGRADIRQRLQGILEGDSAGASALKQDNQQAQKSLKAQQALSGGGQMNEGQIQALQRQSDISQAKFKSDEKRRALADLSKEFRGAGGDILRSSGQYGAISVGGQPPAVAPASEGLFGLGFLGL